MAAWPIYEKLVPPYLSLTDRPLFVVGAILAAFGVQMIGFGLIGEIIIFTQAPNLRDYKVDEIVEGGATAAHAVGGVAHGEGSRREVVRDAGGESGVPVVSSDESPPHVRELLPGEDARWDAFVSRHPQGTFFHLSGWSRVVQETFKHKPYPLVVEQGRRWLGVLPMFLVKSPFLGRNLISLPYAVYGGAISESGAAQAALMARAEALGGELGVGYVELRHLEARSTEHPRSELYVTFRCELPDDPAEVMVRIPKKARAEVRRARAPLAPATDKAPPCYGIVVTPDGSVDELFALFAENKRRLGSPTLPKRWFQAMVDEFGKAVVIHRAVDPTGRTLAAVMSFCFRDTVYAYYSGSLTGINDTGVNNLIYCAIMEWAVEQGYTRFDFGRSRVDSGPAKFKKNMGFAAEPLHYEYLLLGDGAKMPEFHPSNPRLALPRRLWSRLPMPLANLLGARFSRYLP
jgi:FemAB-related protein (PEP-CTERM system-associated)